MRAVLLLASLLPAFAQPHLFVQPADFGRINELAGRERWAADARTSILGVAQAWPQSHLSRFAIKDLELPPEGGQWTLWYVCPVHGVSLQFTAPRTHTCPVDKKTYSGWPYDQVVYMWRHSELSNAARDLALSFRLTGERAYAEAAAWILKQYAAKYPGYAIKDVNNRVATSGARASAQTLDEAVWLIPLAWAYDLLSDVDVLSADERKTIETNLLRAAVTTIQRNDANTSNWQSWHNAAIGSVGFALGDTGLIEAAINGKSGFRFQMKNSVIGEGFWYEGAWGYHFYALDPLTQLADMAWQNGIDLWSEPALRGLFLVPLQLTFADGSLPAFNDSNTQSLFNQARLYEHAYARIGDPLMAAVASQRKRSRESLLFGVPDLPDATLADQHAAVFPDSGYAVLRAPTGDHTVTMKFGPHGGGHGHYDKLGFISYALGGVLGVDPGTQSYAAPTHNTWDLETVAHNTIVLDESRQAAATGKLLWQDLTSEYSAASAQAGAVYKNAVVERSMLVTAEYAVDLAKVASTDGASHQIDWGYHNFGTLSLSPELTPYTGFGNGAAYKNLTANRAATPAAEWTATFDGNPVSPVTYSSVYASASAVSGKFQYSNEQAAGGRYSGKLSYDFRGDGYLLFTVPVSGKLPDAVPTGLRVMFYGDGSGHRLTLRLNDATDERFVITVGPITWQGWKEVIVRDPGQWSHYLGNNDGVVDLPILNATVELGRVAGSPTAGALYLDDVTLLYGDDAPVTIGDFELRTRSLRLWMLGASGATVVAGNGLGPNLLEPVPYVMARRTGAAAEFATLLEPYESAPRVTSFTRTLDGGFIVKGPDFEDTFRFGESGVVGYRRR